MTLSADPFAGARLAFFALEPDATDADWDNFLHTQHHNRNDDIDNYRALARLCRDFKESGINVPSQVAELIAYSSGCFEVMGRLVANISCVMPVSNWIPHHMSRYRKSIVRPEVVTS